jgi:hypothetical protein
MATPVRVMNDPASRPPSVLLKDPPGPWLKPDSPGTRPDPQPRPPQTPLPITSAQPAYDISAHSVQFVASPNQTRQLQSALPAAIREALSVAPAFAGCMVMVSDQEARLVTVVTLWSGQQRIRYCNENADQVKKLVSPYVDHWLRTETNVAHFSILSPLERKFQECCTSTETAARLKPR